MKKGIIEYFEDLVNVISDTIKCDLDKAKNVCIVLNAYNFYLEEEHGGDNYIFDIDNKSDFKYLVDKDLITPIDVIAIMGNTSHWFRFDDNGNIVNVPPKLLITILKNNIAEVLCAMFAYVNRCGEDSPYSELYECYITETLVGCDFVC